MFLPRNNSLTLIGEIIEKSMRESETRYIRDALMYARIVGGRINGLLSIFPSYLCTHRCMREYAIDALCEGGRKAEGPRQSTGSDPETIDPKRLPFSIRNSLAN